MVSFLITPKFWGAAPILIWVLVVQRLFETRRLLEEIRYLLRGTQKVYFFRYFRNNLKNTDSTTIFFAYQKTRIIFPYFNVVAKALASRN